MLDFQIDFQSWRHRDTARLARKALYHALVGAQGWPPTFRRPSPEGQDHVGASPHIYVHIPFCRSICPHCPYNKLLFDADLADRYGRALIAEIDAYLAWPGRVPIESLYFGGGTPIYE